MRRSPTLTADHRAASLLLIAASLVACDEPTQPTVFQIRSTVDPSAPLEIEASATVPSEWPSPESNGLGEPHFSFGGGHRVSLGATQVSVQGNDPRGRVDAVIRDQLHPDSVDSVELPGGRRWITERDAGSVRAWLHVPGPADSVLTCAFFMPVARESEARRFCHSVEVR